MDEWNSLLVGHLVRVGVLSIASVLVSVIFGTERERRSQGEGQAPHEFSSVSPSYLLEHE